MSGSPEVARRRLERRRTLEPWARCALLGLPGDDLDEMQWFNLALDADVATLLPLWRQHRAELLQAWGSRPHPMDGQPPRLPQPRR